MSDTDKVKALLDELRKIAEYGSKNPGYGWTVTKMAKAAIRRYE